MKRRLFSFSGALALLLLCGCAEQGMETEAPGEAETLDESTVGQHTATTNIQEDAIPSTPGAGAAVGANPAGAGTSELREEAGPNE